MTAPVIAWLRRNLRLADNPSLAAAVESGRPVLAVYVHDDNDAGGASHWWLHHSLERLGADLEQHGNRLLLARGPADEALSKLADIADADGLYYECGYSALERAEEEAVADSFAGEVHSHHDYYLHAPGSVLTAAQSPYKVFTPFWKACVGMGEPPRPNSAPEHVPACAPAVLDKLRDKWPSCTLPELDLLPRQPDWAGGLRQTWTPGEDGAHDRLAGFVDSVGAYAAERDRPDREGTSRLSPHLHFGEISVRAVWHAIHDAAQASRAARGGEAYLRQLYWRDFSGHLLFHFPEMPAVPLRPEFERFPWASDEVSLQRWQQGYTGVPIVDAGMRELWSTGWMHNRVRMIVASFLVKNLMIPWQQGAAWFLDTLVDADLANNSASWQWVAGCGTDSAPYFRIFNPVLQGQKFDPKGEYVRRWVQELRDMPDELIHEPSGAGNGRRQEDLLVRSAYPPSIVDLGESRQRALTAYQDMRDMARAGSS